MTIMVFDNIVLLPNEEKLLRGMADGEARDVGTLDISNLRGYELVDMIQIFSSPDYPQPYKMQYKINEVGKGYLRYLDRKNQNKKQERKGFWITLIVASATLLFTVAALIVAIFALLK